MNADSSERNVADEAREMREHERQAQARDDREGAPAGEQEAGIAADDGPGRTTGGDDDAGQAVPPGQTNLQ